jgi:alkylation response protein AidB-like acyl-CoA dehydrogenase
MASMTTVTPNAPPDEGDRDADRAAQEEFRRELRRFLVEELTDERRRAYLDEGEYGGWSPAYIREFRMKLGERGYIGVGWPAEYGGGGKGMTYEVILADEMEYFGAPGLDRTITYLPQALITFGTDDQRRRLLPPLRRGEISLCTAYSEPEAGSDLASLQLAAVPDGDGFVIEGQKEYCSQAHIADFAILAARTKKTERNHQGVSLFIVDMHDERIHITPHRTVAGWLHHSVYFDRVAVSGDMLLGPLHEGWSVLMGAVDHERAALSAPGEVAKQLDRLIDWACAQSPDGQRPIDNDATADRLVGLAIDEEVARAYAYELAERQDRGGAVGSDASLAQLLKRQAARSADALAMDLLGINAQLTRTSPRALLGGHVEYETRDHLYYSFAAGGFDIIRNVIATRGLGLPR